VQHDGLTWVDIKHPGREEIAWLQAHFPNFHPLHLIDVASIRQHPKLDEHADYLFMVMHFPLFIAATRIVTPGEVDFFAGPDYLITAHAGQLRPLLGLLDQACDIPATRAEIMGRGSGYLLYTITSKLVDCAFPLLDRLDDEIESLEDQIFTGNPQQTVQEISLVRREVISLRHVIRPQMVMNTLERRAPALVALLGEDFTEYFSDVDDHLRNIRESLEDYKDVIEGLSDTYNSLTNTHINNVIKVLTIFSVILLPMTLIASVYGMNFEWLPLSKDPDGFWLAMGGMLLVGVAMLAFFKNRRWM
jgi:magnesium transporter